METKWAGLRRLTTYYLNRDWHHFDNGLDGLVPESHRTFSQEWQRDHVFHMCYDLLLRPIWTMQREPHYPSMKDGWNALWANDGPHFRELLAFARREINSTVFGRLQSDLLGQVARIVDLRSALLPGVLLDLIPTEREGIIPTLRLFRDEFEALRDLYVQVFEGCHKGLRYIIGAVNISRSGSPDAFEPWPAPAPSGRTKVPVDLDSFDRLASADKRVWLMLLPAWDREWDIVLDRHLRNDIGHASVRHDLPSGMLLRDRHDPIAYTEFVRRTQRVLQPLLAVLGAMKILRVYSFASPS